MILPTSTSRLLGVPIFDDLVAGDFYEIRTPMPFSPVQGMTEITLRDGETLHALAFQFFGDPQLWWAIADYNSIFDITTEVFAGRVIQVPTFAYIDAFLTNPEQLK